MVALPPDDLADHATLHENVEIVSAAGHDAAGHDAAAPLICDSNAPADEQVRVHL